MFTDGLNIGRSANLLNLSTFEKGKLGRIIMRKLVVRIINEEFENTVPFIHKEAEGSYMIIQQTPNGMQRIMKRVSSEFLARQFVNRYINEVINKPKGYPV